MLIFVDLRRAQLGYCNRFAIFDSTRDTFLQVGNFTTWPNWAHLYAAMITYGPREQEEIDRIKALMPRWAKKKGE